MLLAQSEAAKLAMESLPKDVTAQQFVAPNGQLLIALTKPAAPQIDPRWNEPSAIRSRCRCGIC
eukprot:5857931-Amphidinium_carterae.1